MLKQLKVVWSLFLQTDSEGPTLISHASIDYDLAKTGDAWKVFDVSVAGVSLVTNYRETFSQEIKTGGLDGLIKSLRDKNQQLTAKQVDTVKK